MRIASQLGFTLFLVVGALVAQEDGERLQSGPKVGEVLPGPFDAFNINGRIAAGRQHCLVCDYGLHPVVMVFAREPAEGKDGPLAALLAKLDDAVRRHADDHALGGCAVFLSADGQNSATNATEHDPKKIADEALARDALAKRLEERAEKLKNVVVAYLSAQGPKEYHINPKAEVTVLFYIKHKVLANFAFPEGKMQASHVDNIIKFIEDALAKKRPAKK
jgi:hypothetical protein